VAFHTGSCIVSVLFLLPVEADESESHELDYTMFSLCGREPVYWFCSCHKLSAQNCSAIIFHCLCISGAIGFLFIQPFSKDKIVQRQVCSFAKTVISLFSDNYSEGKRNRTRMTLIKQISADINENETGKDVAPLLEI
jgi:hypothetical protein